MGSATKEGREAQAGAGKAGMITAACIIAASIVWLSLVVALTGRAVRKRLDWIYGALYYIDQPKEDQEEA